MHQNRIAGAHGEQAVQQVLGRHAAQQLGGGHFQAQALGQRQRACRGHQPQAGVGAWVQVDHRVAGAKASHARPHRLHVPGADGPRHERKALVPMGPRRTGAGIDVGVVQADGRLLQTQLARAGVGHLQRRHLQHLGPAMAVHLDGLGAQLGHVQVCGGIEILQCMALIY